MAHLEQGAALVRGAHAEEELIEGGPTLQRGSKAEQDWGCSTGTCLRASSAVSTANILLRAGREAPCRTHR